MENGSSTEKNMEIFQFAMWLFTRGYITGSGFKFRFQVPVQTTRNAVLNPTYFKERSPFTTVVSPKSGGIHFFFLGAVIDTIVITHLTCEMY